MISSSIIHVGGLPYTHTYIHKQTHTLISLKSNASKKESVNVCVLDNNVSNNVYIRREYRKFC